MQLVKNSIYTIKIDAYSSNGEGIGRIDGIAVFVKGALKGELCKIKIIKVQKTHAWARLQNVIEKSQNRIKPDCVYYKTCGGCLLRHMSYDEELIFKKQKINDALWKIGKLDLHVSKVFSGNVEPASIYNYRNKAAFPVAFDTNQKLCIGLYQTRSHNIINIDTCKIQAKICDKIIAIIKKWMNDFNIEPYNEKYGTGLIRHIYIRTNYKDDVLLCLVTNKQEIPYLNYLLENLIRQCSGLVGVVQNINDKKINAIRGIKYNTLYGKNYITDMLCGLKFNLDSSSFFQVNRYQAEILYKRVLSLAKIKQDDTVLDLYCGTGTISILMAKYAKQVYGVEIVEAAIRNANINSEANNVKNVNFVCATAKKATSHFLDEGLNFDLICVDPPRKGLDNETINSCIELSPKKILYISCNPATLARDLQIFENKGYKAKVANMVDMFARTPHVETIVLLEYQY